MAIILYKSAQTIHKSVNQQQQHYDKFISPKKGKIMIMVTDSKVKI